MEQELKIESATFGVGRRSDGTGPKLEVKYNVLDEHWPDKIIIGRDMDLIIDAVDAEALAAAILLAARNIAAHTRTGEQA